MAFPADWFSRKEMRPSAGAQSVLLVDRLPLSSEHAGEEF